jgi:hypothetical protein
LVFVLGKVDVLLGGFDFGFAVLGHGGTSWLARRIFAAGDSQ